MPNQLVPASYTQTNSSTNLSARAISASITTSNGNNLYIAAISQKKQGHYANGDTPRMALFSFLTGLQSGHESSISKLIAMASSQAADAVQSFVKSRQGAPCSLTVAIVLEKQLFSLQIGAGRIISIEDGKLSKSPKALPEIWLGESAPVGSLEQIATKKLNEPNVSLIVCQDSFANLFFSDPQGSVHTYTMLAKDKSAEALPSALATWGSEQGIDQELTLATLHVEKKKLVDFFTLDEAFLGDTKAFETAKRPSSSHPVINLLDQESENTDQTPVGEEEQPHTPSIHLGAPRDKEVVPTMPPVIFPLPNAEETTKESQVIANDYVLFSSATTIPSQAIDATTAAPIMPKGLTQPTVKVKPTRAAAASPQKLSNALKAKTDRQKYQQLKSFAWPLIAALFTILLLLISIRFFATRWTTTDDPLESSALPADATLAQTTNLPPLTPSAQEQGSNCTSPNNDENCLSRIVSSDPTKTATATASPTQTPTQLPTATNTSSPTPLLTETAEPTLSPPVGQLIQTTGEIAQMIEIGDIIIADRLVRVAFFDAAAVNEVTDSIDEVYAFPGSVLSFSSNNQEQQIEAEQGTTLFLNSQVERIQTFLPAGNWTLENQNGCMAIDYSRADRPIIASCYAGTCSWADGSGVKNSLAEGERIGLILDSQDSEAELIPTSINSNESLAFYRQLSADPSGAAVANKCIGRFLPPPTPVPTITPTPTSTPVPPTPNPPSNAGSNNPKPTATPPPRNTIAPTLEPTTESTPTKEQLPERPTATLGALQPTTIPNATPEATAANTNFPATSTPLP
ncbi:MAG: hypothetical protein AB8G95_20225 [Anaerolineae bacterium]